MLLVCTLFPEGLPWTPIVAFINVLNCFVFLPTERPTLNIRDGDNDEKRDIIAGGPAVNLTCSSDGIPSPTARWFYNGGSISSSCGAIDSGDYVLIPTPQVCNSGIYQCFVSNAFGFVQRSFVIEVTGPSKGSFFVKL